ncbi:hypothetical protein ABW20_dc0107641 [Dactylellina cionopaga]|nr:hypothetical protein ABW20_dc0107641 [Dactylellina cionopaga]
MGGIVAADTLLSILDDEPIKKPVTSPASPSSSGKTGGGSLDPRKNKESPSSSSSSSYFPKVHDDVLSDERILFPAIIGICAFDTPYLGLSRSMFANSAQNNFRQASDAFSTVSSIAKTLGLFQAQEAPAASLATSSSGAQAAALPSAGQAASSGWGWGKLAMVAAAATTVSAGAGAAVYWNRTNITQGFSWVTSHLSFVGVLFRPDELKARVMRVSAVPDVGVTNFYTVLGKGTKAAATPGGRALEVGGGGLRTFCSLPPRPSDGPSSPSSSKAKPASPGASSVDSRGAADIDVGNRDLRTWWFAQLNDKAPDEVTAHMYMFNQSTNPGYKDLLDAARKQVMIWSINWYDAGV